jgi:hypothetical protein
MYVFCAYVSRADIFQENAVAKRLQEYTFSRCQTHECQLPDAPTQPLTDAVDIILPFTVETFSDARNFVPWQSLGGYP